MSEFDTHVLNAAGKAKCDTVRAEFDRLLGALVEIVPPGRERSIVITKLQEACMFANRGVASALENQSE